jgi:hypothetical protein
VYGISVYQICVHGKCLFGICAWYICAWYMFVWYMCMVYVCLVYVHGIYVHGICLFGICVHGKCVHGIYVHGIYVHGIYVHAYMFVWYMCAVLEEPEDPANKSFFSEIISSISDLQFSRDSGRYLMVRDFMSVKVWDLQMTSRPVESYAVHEYLRGKLCALYESDCLFDKFTCCWSGSDRCVLIILLAMFLCCYCV